MVATADDFGKVGTSVSFSFLFPSVLFDLCLFRRSNYLNGHVLPRPLFAGSTVGTAATCTACGSRRATSTWCFCMRFIVCTLAHASSHTATLGLHRRGGLVCHAGASPCARVHIHPSNPHACKCSGGTSLLSTTRHMPLHFIEKRLLVKIFMKHARGPYHRYRCAAFEPARSQFLPSRGLCHRHTSRPDDLVAAAVGRRHVAVWASR